MGKSYNLKKIVANNREKRKMQNNNGAIDKSVAELHRSRKTKSGAYVRNTKTDERERRFRDRLGREKDGYFFMAIYLL